jgi:3D (Asp-Asp-Asp) domain-containing protein
VAFALAGALSAGSACAPFGRPSPPGPTSAPPPETAGARELEVTARAYNSLPEQTDGDPARTASGAQLRPGMRAIAVSEDLLAMGLGYGTRVIIEGLSGEWVVLDRMGSRHRRAIDVYLGEDRESAVRFGERRVRIRWSPAASQ